jgi:hypothetical protein
MSNPARGDVQLIIVCGLYQCWWLLFIMMMMIMMIGIIMPAVLTEVWFCGSPTAVDIA